MAKSYRIHRLPDDGEIELVFAPLGPSVAFLVTGLSFCQLLDYPAAGVLFLVISVLSVLGWEVVRIDTKGRRIRFISVVNPPGWLEYDHAVCRKITERCRDDDVRMEIRIRGGMAGDLRLLADLPSSVEPIRVIHFFHRNLRMPVRVTRKP